MWQLSAQKCKFDYNKKDPITGEMTKSITIRLSKILVIHPYHSGMRFSRVGDTYYLELCIHLAGNQRDIISKGGAPLTFSLPNGETITIYSQAETLPIQQASEAGISTIYIIKYDIDAVSLQKMAENPPTFYRLYINNSAYDKELPEKVQKKISQAATCILQ